MCMTDEERALYNEIGLRINWNSISTHEWEQMLKRNEQSKQLEKQYELSISRSKEQRN